MLQSQPVKTYRWREEDATNDPQELERRDAETNDLMTNLQASRLSLRDIAENQYAA